MKLNPLQEFTVWNWLFVRQMPRNFLYELVAMKSLYWFGLYFSITLSPVPPNEILAVIPAPLFSALLQTAKY
jgi:hypothetical protein